MIIIPTREQFITHTHKTKTAQPTTQIGHILYSEKQQRALFVVGGRSGGSFPPFFFAEKIFFDF